MGLLDWLPWGGGDEIEERTVTREEIPQILIATAIEDVLNEPDSAATLLDEIEQVESYVPGTRAIEHLAIILTGQLVAMRQDDRLRPFAEEIAGEEKRIFVEESLEEDFKSSERVELFYDLQAVRTAQYLGFLEEFLEEEGNIGRTAAPLGGLSFKGQSLLSAYLADQYRIYRDNFDAWTIVEAGEQRRDSRE